MEYYVKKGLVNEIGGELKTALRNVVGLGDTSSLAISSSSSKTQDIKLEINFPRLLGLYRLPANLTAKVAEKNLGIFQSIKRSKATIKLFTSSLDNSERVRNTADSQ